MLDAVTHLDSRLFPCLEAEVAKLQQGLIFGIADLLNQSNDLGLQINQLVDIGVDLIFQHDDLDNHIFHAMRIGSSTSRHIGNGRSCLGSKVMERCNLLDFTVVIISYDDADGRIMKKYEQWGHQSQMSLIVGKDIGNINDLVDYYLPKPSIDRASIRMSEILKQRFDQPMRRDQEGEEST